MTSRPWMKFYPRDWRGDQALRAVSLTARGLWIECLCLMHEADPRGHLLLNGKKVAVDTLARMVGASSDEVSAAMLELQSAGVFTQARNGVVTSRRMIQDEKAANEGSKSARKRWDQVNEKKGKNDDPNRVGHTPPTQTPNTQRPEYRKKERTITQQQQPVTESERAGERVVSERFDRASADALEARLREAAGYEAQPAPNLCVIGPIEALIGEGFDLEREILPAIRAKALSMPKPAQSWAYFVGVIREARDRSAGAAGGPAADAARIADDMAEARRRLSARAATRGDA